MMNAFDKKQYQMFEDFVYGRKHEIRDVLSKINIVANKFWLHRFLELTKLELIISTNNAWYLSATFSNFEREMILIPDEFVECSTLDKIAFERHFRKYFAEEYAREQSHHFESIAEKFKSFPRHIAVEMLEMLCNNCKQDKTDLWSWNQMTAMREQVESKLTDHYGK